MLDVQRKNYAIPGEPARTDSFRETLSEQNAKRNTSDRQVLTLWSSLVTEDKAQKKGVNSDEAASRDATRVVFSTGHIS